MEFADKIETILRKAGLMTPTQDLLGRSFLLRRLLVLHKSWLKPYRRLRGRPTINGGDMLPKSNPNL
jgi:hypothetical protein